MAGKSTTSDVTQEHDDTYIRYVLRPVCVQVYYILLKGLTLYNFAYFKIIFTALFSLSIFLFLSLTLLSFSQSTYFFVLLLFIIKYVLYIIITLVLFCALDHSNYMD